MDLKATLNLPDPNFTIPMKADLAIREPEILAEWKASQIYHQLQKERKDAPAFVLHDGPPYTNSAIHLGTAMNKILKDFVLKSRLMMGYRVPYVPGYDNHGLPIEQAVMKKFAEKKEKPDLPTLRQACRDHAAEYIKIQTEQFERLGIFGLWEKPYRTMDFRFEAAIVRVFGKLVSLGQVYRGLKPVMWSPTSRTALADTEIVYEEHVSKSIFVRFPLLDDHNGWSKGLENVYTIIWTTTPWTIPANLGVAFHPGLDYVIAKVGGDHYVVQEDLAPSVFEKLGLKYEVVRTLLGSSFEFSKFKHPIYERESLGVLANYVTTEDGTGVVHTAPGHGREDFMTGAKYGLPVLCPVNEAGVLTEEAAEFAGVKYTECDTVVVNRLQGLGALLHVEDYHHQYPHAERDGKPVIFRATEQWFVSMEDNGLRAQMLDQIEQVQWVPESGYGRIKGMIGGRPDWCISRQRPWGVGIPVFYTSSRMPVLDSAAIEAVAQLIEREGSDAWYTKSPAEILPSGYSFNGETEFTKETDVFDVWFDSGSTNIAVLGGDVYPEWKEALPADLYLEGSDQHRGWFNVSMVIGTAANGAAPYKAVVTHGFVTDEQGRKMSKRLGNVIDPNEVCASLGADVLRYWCASVNYADDVPCGQDLLKVSGEGYRTIRNTLRFLLGNLYDYDLVVPTEILEIDQWIIEQAELLVAEVNENYRDYEFKKALSAINDFCIKQLSAFYLDAIKDRMYCDGAKWHTRRSGQHACHVVLGHLLTCVAPILPFTAEETYARFPGAKLASIFSEVMSVPSTQRLAEIEAGPLQVRYARLLEIRGEVFARFEEWKRENEAKNGQAVVAHIREDADTVEFLKSFGQDELANLFKFSWVEIAEDPSAVDFTASTYLQCERSKLYRPDVEEVQGMKLSQRDRRAVGI
ncbi:MAG: isoleucine--tRNA ligase [Chthonomonas sp.]|nr:isoleucine--tRNA ligase [Chthonomonas sp.]